MNHSIRPIPTIAQTRRAALAHAIRWYLDSNQNDEDDIQLESTLVETGIISPEDTLFEITTTPEREVRIVTDFETLIIDNAGNTMRGAE